MSGAKIAVLPKISFINHLSPHMGRMARKLIHKSSRKAGQSPGTLLHIGAKQIETPRISIFDYGARQLNERKTASVEECLAFRESPTVTWLNVIGLHNPEIVSKIGLCFGMHPLVQEDILNTNQRPKIEDYEDYLYTVVKMLSYDEKTNELDIEQVSLILGKNFVITFQEKEGDVFNPLRERLKNPEGKTRKAGADYLYYALLDTIVDSYFIILEKIGEKIEALEEALVKHPRNETLQEIHALKREMIYLRKSVWPLREVVSTLERGESKLISKPTMVYLRDAYDHTIQVIDTVETFRDMLSGMVDLYLSSLSNRMNEVMKVLTVIATIFIPLTFIAGVYGMNFKYMPELSHPLGYFAVWGVMLVVAGTMFLYFRKKKWL